MKIVKLNVGGHPYQVSRALLEKYPQSLITRTVVSAEESHNRSYDDSESSAEVFICGDGTAFRYVLNYLRHGHVFLPITETKASFMNELSHYGIVANPDEVYAVGQDIQPQRVPCSCTGPCVDSCECKRSQQICMRECACASTERCGAASQSAQYSTPCDCLGPCRASCSCRKSHRSCGNRCGCHGRCT